MGAYWIPCRVEAGCSNEELSELVRREAMHFRIGGASSAARLDPRIRFSEPDREQIRRDYLEMGPLHQRLLFKLGSHTIAGVSADRLFPIAWRIDAERTILPWELAGRLDEWKPYREEVRAGGHRRFLQQLYVFACLHELVTVDLANLIAVVEYSRTATGGWASRPEVVALRDEILAAPILDRPIPPDWPSNGEEADLTVVENAFAKVESSVCAWNDAAQRGNVRRRLPKRPPPFEQWIAARLGDDWFPSFLAWAEPWKSGAYGLYRDCE